MATHTLVASQFVAQPPEVVVPFFERPENLARITPSSMDMRIVSSDLRMRDGLEIDYTLRPLPFFTTSWCTRIVAYDPPHGFTDVQLKGPYRRWEHRHEFVPVAGGTRVDDRIEYELPLGPLGALVHSLVRSELEQIFTHRARVVDAVFEPAGRPADGVTLPAVAVAGGTGFVGGAIARELRRRGHRVVVLSSRGEEARGALPDDVEIRPADVTTGRGLRVALEDVDALVVALAFPNSPIERPRRGFTFEAVDAAGTERLVEAARESGVEAVLYISGAGAGAQAKRHWFRAKWRAEEAVRASSLRWTILRPTWIYGPGDVSLNRFVGFARRLPAVPLTNLGRQRLAPVFVDDVAAAAADLLVRPIGAEATFEIGGPEVLEMREVVQRAVSIAGVGRPVIPGPTALLKLGSLPLTAALGRDMRRLDEGLSTYLGRLPVGSTLSFA